MRKRIAALGLLLCLCLTGCAAKTDAVIRMPERPAASVEPPAKKEDPADCTPVPVYFDALLAARGLEKLGTLFVPVGALCRYAGLETEWSGDEKSFSFRAASLRLAGEAGTGYLKKKKKNVYAPEGWLIHAGELYLSERALDKLFSLSSARDEAGLHLDFADFEPLKGGDNYYELNYPEEELYWLSHIISAEARFEPLAGQIAVGNVVMNRVMSEDFPDTVFEVIYDTEHVIQFEPVALGGIREDPSEQAVIASYLVLEGASTVGDCLYFVNPEFGSYWFDSALELQAVIGHHNFYTDKD